MVYTQDRTKEVKFWRLFSKTILSESGEIILSLLSVSPLDFHNLRIASGLSPRLLRPKLYILSKIGLIDSHRDRYWTTLHGKLLLKFLSGEEDSIEKNLQFYRYLFGTVGYRIMSLLSNSSLTREEIAYLVSISQDMLASYLAVYEDFGFILRTDNHFTITELGSLVFEIIKRSGCE